MSSVPIKIGRKVNQKTIPEPFNLYFDAKVLSRTHAQVHFNEGKIYIQDLQSSNGTFVNSKRLSDEGEVSALAELNHGDVLEFGVDIKDEEGNVLYKKVSCSVSLMIGSSDQTIVRAPQNVTADNNEFLTQLDVITVWFKEEINAASQAAVVLDRIRKSFSAMEEQASSTIREGLNSETIALTLDEFRGHMTFMDAEIVSLRKSTQEKNEGSAYVTLEDFDSLKSIFETLNIEVATHSKELERFKSEGNINRTV